jgi:hypothetical protein
VSLRPPEWVPPPIRQEACALFAEAESDKGRELLRRLACNPEMDNVWRRLLATKRSGEYRHAAIAADWWNPWAANARADRQEARELRARGDEEMAQFLDVEAAQCEQLHEHEERTLPPPDPLAVQYDALKHFFGAAYQLAMTEPLRAIPLRDARKMLQPLRTGAKRLRGLAVVARNFSLAHPSSVSHDGRSFVSTDHARELERMAAIWEAWAGHLHEANAPLLVTRRTQRGKGRREPVGSMKLRGFVRALAHESRSLFGFDAPDCVAVIANVVFEPEPSLDAKGVGKLLR